MAAAVAWIWLDEALTAAQMVGGALVLVGVAAVEAARAPEGATA